MSLRDRRDRIKKKAQRRSKWNDRKATRRDPDKVTDGKADLAPDVTEQEESIAQALDIDITSLKVGEAKEFASICHISMVESLLEVESRKSVRAVLESRLG